MSSRSISRQPQVQASQNPAQPQVLQSQAQIPQPPVSRPQDPQARIPMETRPNAVKRLDYIDGQFVSQTVK